MVYLSHKTHRQRWMFPKNLKNSCWQPTITRPSHAEFFSEGTAVTVQRRRMPMQGRDGSSAGARTLQPELRWTAQQLSKAQMLNVTIISINQTRSACFLLFAVLTTMISLSCTFTLLQDVVSSSSDGFFWNFFFFFARTQLVWLVSLAGFIFASFFFLTSPQLLCRIIPKPLDKNN